MTAPLQIGPFVGVNNRLPPDKLQRSQQEGGGQFVSSAVNIDFTGANTTTPANA